MPNGSVPGIDANPEEGPGNGDRLQEIELRLLDAGAKSKENQNREADQRYNLRRIAVGVAVVLILGMGVVLWHGTHRLFSPSYFDVPAPYVVAIFLAPIVSMTSLAVAILVAAFRGFSGSDAEGIPELATDAAKTTVLNS